MKRHSNHWNHRRVIWRIIYLIECLGGLWMPGRLFHLATLLVLILTVMYSVPIFMTAIPKNMMMRNFRYHWVWKQDNLKYLECRQTKINSRRQSGEYWLSFLQQVTGGRILAAIASYGIMNQDAVLSLQALPGVQTMSVQIDGKVILRYIKCQIDDRLWQYMNWFNTAVIIAVSCQQCRIQTRAFPKGGCSVITTASAFVLSVQKS